jgi:hypothetical protein
MQQSRLIRYIKKLSVRDRDRFSQFVYSPYFNQHQKTQELLDLILVTLEEDESKLERREIFRRLFPKEPYEEQKLFNTMSYLMKLYYRFLAIEQLEKTPFSEELFMLEAAYDSKQFDLLTNRARQLEKNLDGHPHRDAHFHYANFHLNRLMGYYRVQYVDRSFSANMQQMLNHLDYFYLSNKLYNCCHLVANMMLMNTRYDLHLLEPLLKYVHENWDIYRKEPSVELYYTILRSLREKDNPQHYEYLKKMMATRIDSLSKEEQKDLYEFSYNYCITQINSGRQAYLRELFQLYRQGLQNGMLLNNGMLSEFMYKNIVTLGCKLKEFKWTEQFIQQYKDYLPAHRQENAYKFNLAILYYNKEMYEETLSTLLHVQFTDVKYHLNTNFLLLRTYYAMHDTEALLSLIDTFRIYVIRNRKMTTEQKRGYTNFLRFAKRLVLLKHQASTYSKKSLKEKLQILTKKIENTDNIINSSWLLEECQSGEEVEA